MCIAAAFATFVTTMICNTEPVIMMLQNWYEASNNVNRATITVGACSKMVV